MNKFEHVQGGRFVVRFKVQSEQVEHILGIHDWVQSCVMGPYVGRTAQDQAVPHDLSLTNKITGSGHTEVPSKQDNRQTQLKILLSHNYVGGGKNCF